MTHSTSTNTLLDSIGMQPCDDFFHSQSLPSKAFMLLRQGVSLRTVCEDRQAGITTVALFLFLWRACMFVRRLPLAAAFVSVCLSRLLAARPVRICVLPMCTCATCEQADAC